MGQCCPPPVSIFPMHITCTSSICQCKKISLFSRTGVLVLSVLQVTAEKVTIQIKSVFQQLLRFQHSFYIALEHKHFTSCFCPKSYFKSWNSEASELLRFLWLKRPWGPWRDLKNLNKSLKMLTLQKILSFPWTCKFNIQLKIGVLNGISFSSVAYSVYLLSLCRAIIILGGKLELFPLVKEMKVFSLFYFGKIKAWL